MTGGRIQGKKMNRLAQLATLITAIVCHAQYAVAQENIKILTPNSDSCAVFIQALNTNQESQLSTLIALGGWATGYLSGVAQGTGIDFLRAVQPPNTSVFLRLEKECQQQPKERLSIVLEKLSREMIAEHTGKR